MQKLTLSVDERVVARAKAYAQARGTSVSRLVEAYLDLVARARTPAQVRERRRTTPPVLARLRGSLPRGSVADYRRHLARKYL
jgi:Family of unknown function (DUF6364)